MSTKLETWPELMQAYLQRVRHKPFAWGTFDCCMFAADCVLAMTGDDPAKDFRGRYNDAASAVRALRSYSGGLLLPTMQSVAAEQGWVHTDNPLHVHRGDVVMGNPDVLSTDRGLDGNIGICVGTISLFVNDDGLMGVSTIEVPGEKPNILHGWHIPVARG